MNSAIHLNRQDPACNMTRFYRLELTADLFCGVTLTKQWGWTGRDGQARRAWLAGAEEACEARKAWMTRKCRREYREAGGALSAV
ncbi:WGR domain-containing protein [Paracoccus zhejiangensis]|nr:WGR domain-containing protein [Paracoccus zhejiangensis]